MQVDAEENDNDDGEIRMVADALMSGAVARGAGNFVDAAAAVMGFVSGGNEDQRTNFDVENPSLDLDSYAASYTNLGRLLRLKFVAKHCSTLRVEALKLAIQHCSNTHNVALYGELQKNLLQITGSVRDPGASSSSGGGGGNLPDVAAAGSSSSGTTAGAAAAAGQQPSTVSGLPAAVTEWMETRSRRAALKLEKLDTDLKNYRSNSIKESIRRGHDDLGDHYLDCGDLSNALKCYSRARDYCTTGRHVINMCVNVIRVSVYLQNWSHVTSYVNKATATPDFGGGGSSDVTGNVALRSQEHQAIVMRLTCCSGLADLATRNYKAAARAFLSANLDNCDMADLMSAQNIATYGGLCALATLERGDLFKQVIASSSFKLFLELDPQLREVIANFHGSKYGKCLKLLDEMKDNLMLDMYLAPHVSTLYSMIRNRSLVQYFSPYLSADLRLMAASFNTNVNDLENELMSLILDGQIQARIDSHNKVLFSQDVDQRNVTFEHAVDMANLYQRRARMLILRSAILKSDVVVKFHRNASGQGNNQQEGGGGGAFAAN